MDKTLISLQAKLDQLKSVSNINADIKKLQGQLKQISVQAKVDPKAAQVLAEELDQTMNQKLADRVNEINRSIDNGYGASHYQNQINSLINDFQKYGVEVETAKTQTSSLQQIFDNMKGLSGQELITQADKFEQEFKAVKISIDEAKLSYEKLTSSKQANNGILKSINNFRISFFNALSDIQKRFTAWMSTFRQTINTVKELDTALANLKQTTNMSSSELNRFYFSANDIAKQMGFTTKEIIEQATAWSKLGFHTAESAAKMAKYSSMLAAISPGMSLDAATDALASVMNAFKIGLEDTDDVVDGILSKINIIGNTQFISNTDIVDFLIRSSNAMAEANNTLEDTIALGSAMAKITGDAAGAGQVLKTVSMRVRGYDENTEEFIGGVEELSGKIADLTKTASTPGGISLFSDKAQTQYKSTRQLLQEISEIYDQLTDKNQDELLDVLAGSGDSQAVAAILSNFDTVTSSLESMANSAGNADAQMAVAMDSIDYKLNRVKETGTGIAQNLFGREDIKAILDVINSLGEGLDWLTDKLGLLGTLGLGAGLFAGIKNVGKPKMFGFNFCY